MQAKRSCARQAQTHSIAIKALEGRGMLQMEDTVLCDSRKINYGQGFSRFACPREVAQNVRASRSGGDWPMLCDQPRSSGQ